MLGGAVVSSSGLFACDAGETCTIDINEHHFAETFTAVADAGYTFNRWETGTGAICSGSLNTQCDELDNDSFGGFDRGTTASRPNRSPSPGWHRKRTTCRST